MFIKGVYTEGIVFMKPLELQLNMEEEFPLTVGKFDLRPLNIFIMWGVVN